jgi:hypothetical protein
MNGLQRRDPLFKRGDLDDARLLRDRAQDDRGRRSQAMQASSRVQFSRQPSSVP